MRIRPAMIARRAAAVATVAIAALIMPAYVAPTLIIACGPHALNNETCEKAGESMFYAFFGTLDRWATNHEYGFSYAPGPHNSPSESIAMLRGE